MRYMLYETDEAKVPLEKETEYIQSYIDLQQQRFGKNVKVCTSFNNIGNGDEIEPMLLIPFVENAFKHGVSETRFESFINIDISVKNSRLSFEIENSFEASPGENKKVNIGLINTRRQLELTYREYNLDIKSTNNIFTVNLFINLDSYAEI